jgi:hypothetical protein
MATVHNFCHFKKSERLPPPTFGCHLTKLVHPRYAHSSDYTNTITAMATDPPPLTELNFTS